MTKQKRIALIRAYAKAKFTMESPDFPSWPSNAVVPMTSDHVDAITYNWTQTIRTPFGGPTERQLTLSRLTGRPWDEFIP